MTGVVFTTSVVGREEVKTPAETPAERMTGSGAAGACISEERGGVGGMEDIGTGASNNNGMRSGSTLLESNPG